MKNAWLVLSCFLSLLVPSYGQSDESPTRMELILSGIEDDALVSIAVTHNYTDFQYDTLAASQPGTYIWEKTLSRPQFVKLFLNSKRRDIFLSPGSSLQVKSDSLLQDLSFNGDHAGANTYLIAVYEDSLVKAYAWNTAQEVPIDSFRRTLDLYFGAKEKVLDTYFPTEADKQSFFYQVRLHEQYAFKNYALSSFMRSWVPKASYEDSLLKYFDPRFLDYKKMALYMESDYVRYTYSGPLLDYLSIQNYGKGWRDTLEAKGYTANQLELAAMNYPDPIKSYVILGELDFLVNEGFKNYPVEVPSVDDLLDTYGSMLGEEKEQKLKAVYLENLEQRKAFEKGKKIPSVPLESVSSETVLLDQRVEKPVLYDIWASWCGPCIVNFPKVNEVSTTYEGKLKVISISLDDTKADFISALDRHDVPGMQKYWAPGGFESEFATYFQLNAIPQYLLVDDQGRILSIGFWDEVYETLTSQGWE